MKVNKNRIYPYPIYSELTDDYIENDFAVDAEIEYDSEIATITLNLSLVNEDIRDLIENTLVGLYCHIECSSTKYRKLFELSINNDTDNYNIEIPLSQLNDTIEVLCVLVAKEEILNFDANNLNELYKDIDIRFPQFGTIGYTDTIELTIVKRLDINGDIPSIFTVVSDETQENVQVDYTSDQITIYLPKEEYNIYETYRGTGIRIKQMMVIIPALIEAFDIIKMGDDSFEGLPWYVVLDEALKKKEIDGFSDPTFFDTSSYEIAQKLLGDIAKEAFYEFDAMNQDKED